MTSRTKKIIIRVSVLVLVVVIALGMLIGAVVSGWRAAIRSAIEGGALQTVKSIAAAEAHYFKGHKGTYGTFDQLVEDGFDARFSGEVPNVDGYVYTLKVISKTTNRPSSYVLNADPYAGSAGRNHLYCDSSDNLIRVNADRPAGPNDPAP